MTAKEKVLKILSKKGTRLKFREITAATKLTSRQAEAALSEIRKEHKNLVFAKYDKTFYFADSPTWYSLQTDLSQEMPLKGKFGVVSDTHLGSIAERLDLMEVAYNDFAKQGITKVFHCGDLSDGFRQYKSHMNYVKVYGDLGQAVHVIQKYPNRKGITTYFILGNHDDDHQLPKHNRLSYVVNGCEYEGKHYEGRSDMVMLGEYSHTIILPQEITMHMLHPLGSAPYAMSYKQQKRSEAMDRNNRPDIQFSGHYHTFNYCVVQGTHFVACPGMQDETEFFKRLGLARSVGYMICSYEIKDAKLVAFAPELHML